MNSKTLIGGVIGGVAFFLLGWLIFGIVLMPMTASYTNMSCMRPEAELSLPLLAVANLLWGLTFAYIFSKMPGITGFASAAVQGAIISVLIGLSYDIFMYVFTTMNTSLVIAVYNLIGNIILGGLGGGVIGWWMGRK